MEEQEPDGVMPTTSEIDRAIETLRSGADDRIVLEFLDGTILKHIDTFVEELQGNLAVETVILGAPQLQQDGDNNDEAEDYYERWQKLCTALGGIECLREVKFTSVSQPTRRLDCRSLLTALQNIRQISQLDMSEFLFKTAWPAEYAASIPSAIGGLVSLEEFKCNNSHGAVDINPILKALSTLPRLRIVRLRSFSTRRRLGIRATPLAQLLASSSLRQLELWGCNFNVACCQELSHVTGDGSSAVDLTLERCQIDSRGSGLFCETLVSKLRIERLNIYGCGVPFYEALGASLPASVTLKELHLEYQLGMDIDSLAAIFLGLATNHSLCNLFISGFGLELNNYCADSLRKGLEKNTCLRKLDLDMKIADDVWTRFIPSLQVNKSLKTLSCSNAHLTTDLLVTFVEELKTNVTLKEFFLGRRPKINEALLAAAKQNYGLQSIACKSDWQHRDIYCLLKVVGRLNGAGRSYLITDVASKAKGVDVLGQVSDDLDCLYFHLRENPTLCELKVAVVESCGKKRKAEGEDGAPSNRLVGADCSKYRY